MHWLSQNYQWIFSGIGVLILALLLERWRRSSRSSASDSAALTAQGAKVTASPVASGSGIVQTVNSPTVTVNLGPTAPALPKLEVEIREVCFDDALDSLTKDLGDFTVERYVFVYVWIVNMENVATAVKEWKLTYSHQEKIHSGAEVNDFSK